MNEAVKTLAPASNTASLAVYGGDPVRKTPMPPRLALGEDERQMVIEVLDYYAERKVDPGYQGAFEKIYTDAFVEMMGGGYADAVATGTSALYVSVAALDLPKGSEVMVSPITDPGTLAAIVLNGLTPRLMDSKPDSYNVGPEQFAQRITQNVSAAIIVHAAGYASEIDKIVEIAHAHGIKIIEDCSQAHFAKHKAKPVGTFGDIAAFSTMYRKAHRPGRRGGLIYSRNLQAFPQCLGPCRSRQATLARGFRRSKSVQPISRPALNHHTDEISCAIGYASLRRLPSTIVSRLAFVSDFVARLYDASECLSRLSFHAHELAILLPGHRRCRCHHLQQDRVSPRPFVRKASISIPHYKYVVCEWPYIRRYLADDFDTPNARSIRDRSFNLYLNENYRRAGIEGLREGDRQGRKIF